MIDDMENDPVLKVNAVSFILLIANILFLIAILNSDDAYPISFYHLQIANMLVLSRTLKLNKLFSDFLISPSQ